MTEVRVQIREPFRVEVVQEPDPSPGPGQLQVRASVSAISPGTELLAYRGELPDPNPGDQALDPLTADRTYPMPTGYSVVGTVAEAGQGVDETWIGRCVFAFHPHASCFLASAGELIPLPEDIPAELATFIPNLETAVGLVQDARPLLGERVAVFGQGIVGLLVTRLLARFPLASLQTFDGIVARRERSLASGAHAAHDPGDATDREKMKQAFGESGADLVFELSGNPAALNDAIGIAGFGSRIVVGSWYGRKSVPLDLGGRFHRNRISIVSSQVSTIGPGLSARWDKHRRMRTVLSLLPGLGLEDLISHRFPVSDASSAFNLLDSRPDAALQVLLHYPDQRD